MCRLGFQCFVTECNSVGSVEAASIQVTIQVRRNDEEEPSRMQRDPEKTYYTMLLEKSRELKLKEEKTHLTLKNTSLRRDLSEVCDFCVS